MLFSLKRKVLNVIIFVHIMCVHVCVQENLQGYVQKVFTSITQSSSSCPPLMCDVFRSLRQLASKRFPGDTLLLSFTCSLQCSMCLICECWNFWNIYDFTTRRRQILSQLIISVCVSHLSWSSCSVLGGQQFHISEVFCSGSSLSTHLPAAIPSSCECATKTAVLYHS